MLIKLTDVILPEGGFLSVVVAVVVAGVVGRSLFLSKLIRDLFIIYSTFTITMQYSIDILRATVA